MRGFASKAAAIAKPSKTLISPANPTNPLDQRYISQIIQRKDWFFILKQEFRARRIGLNPRFVISVLQNQENPLHSIRFYIWVSNIDQVYARDQSLKKVLGNVLCRKGPLLLSAELLKEIRDSGLGFTEDLLCILIGSWGKLGLAKYCNDIFGQISFLGISPTTRLYNAVIDALVKSNSLDLAYLKFQQMRSDNCEPDRFTYNILIHGVCKKGVIEEAIRLVKQMEGEGNRPNVFTYTIMIDGFLVAGRIDEALKLVETMQKRKVNLNEATIRTLIHGTFRCLPSHEAFEVLVRFMEKNRIFRRVACDTLLYCLSSSSMAKEVALFLRKISEKGYVPDSSTFNLVMNCLLKGFDLDETCKIFDSFVSQEGFKPGFSSYLEVIQALFKERKVSKGDQYLNQMAVRGHIDSVYAYNAIIDCLCKARMSGRAEILMNEMKNRGISPNLITFNTLISGYSESGNINKVREMLEKLLEKGYKPDVFTFNSIINCLCHAKEIQDAFNCFQEMIQWGICPNEITYNILIRSLCMMGSIGRAFKLFKKMKESGLNPDVYSFNALIQSLCRMNDVEKAEKLMKTMLSMGLNPDNYTYSAVIRALRKCGREIEVREMIGRMERQGCVPDSYTQCLIEEG